MTIKLIITDIEGTTSSISFVKDVLFPYATEHLSEFVTSNLDNKRVISLLDETAKLATNDGSCVDPQDTGRLIEILLSWITEDKKATPLKTLQGMIWEAGYKNGDYCAHMYADATTKLKEWNDKDIPLYVYSSGSVQAQKLFFSYSQDGDLLPLFSGHFDTQIGGKREATSYQNILTDLQEKHPGLQAEEVLFLSDIKEELDAAKAAHMKTCWLIREADLPESTEHIPAKSFYEIELSI